MVQKGLISHGRENFIVVVELWWKLKVPLELRGNLGDPLMFRGGSQICFLVARDPRDSSHIAVGMNRASSRVEAGTSGFLSISDTDLMVSVEFEQGRQASSCVEALNSAFLLSCQ